VILSGMHRQGVVMHRGRHLLPGLCALAFSVAAAAGETIVYRYDELGRLKRVDRSGSVNNGVGAEYAYDPADNRAYVGVGGANPASPATVAGGGFEAPGAATYVYRPTASFAGASGLAANDSAWHFNAAPEGNQVAFLQAPGATAASVSLQVTGMSPGKAYAVSFLLSARPGYLGNPVTVALNGLPIGTFDPPTAAFTPATTAAFTAPASSATLTFTGFVADYNMVTAIDKVTAAPVGQQP
jgi:hypothetical protein